MSTSGEQMDLDATMHETEEELKIPVTDLKLEDVRRKFDRCKVCNRQRFAHPGGSAKYGQGKCDSLDVLAMGSENLRRDDERVDVERESRRGIKRKDPEVENPEAKKLRESANVNFVTEGLTSNSSQFPAGQNVMMEMMNQMMQTGMSSVMTQMQSQLKMTMDMMNQNKQLEIEAEMQKMKFEEERRKEQIRIEDERRELEWTRQQEIFKSLSQRGAGGDFEREDKILSL